MNPLPLQGIPAKALLSGVGITDCAKAMKPEPLDESKGCVSSFTKALDNHWGYPLGVLLPCKNCVMKPSAGAGMQLLLRAAVQHLQCCGLHCISKDISDKGWGKYSSIQQRTCLLEVLRVAS